MGGRRCGALSADGAIILHSMKPLQQISRTQIGNQLPLVAVVTPEAGERTTFNFDVDNTAGGVATGSVQVQVPAGVSTRIDVWTR